MVGLSRKARRMKTHSQDVGASVIKGVLTVSVLAMLAVIFYPVYGRHLPLVPFWVARQAKQRAARVQLGMTDAQVWSTLGLAGRGFRSHISGSGPPQAYPANYVLWPGYVLHMRWNLTTHPATLVKFKFQDRL
jgi:hypothetical protein